MSEQFVKLHKWMATDLHLTGNELIVFAVIHGYTASCGGYKGGVETLGKWCGLSRRNTYRALSPLIEKGYVKQSVSSGGRHAAVYVSLVNRVNMTQLDAQLTVSNRDGKPCQNDTHIDIKDNIDTPYSPPKGDGAHAGAKPERKRRPSGKRNRALQFIHSETDYSEEGLKRIGISTGEEFYDSLDELRIE